MSAPPTLPAQHQMTQTGLLPTGNAPAIHIARAANSPCRVRQWELVEFAGKGSLARIYRARPAGGPAERPANYAVKMLRRCWRDDSAAIRLLQREALVGQSVSHPHLVPVLAALGARAAAAAGHAVAGWGLASSPTGRRRDVRASPNRSGSPGKRPRLSTGCTRPVGCTAT